MMKESCDKLYLRYDAFIGFVFPCEPRFRKAL